MSLYEEYAADLAERGRVMERAAAVEAEAEEAAAAAGGEDPEETQRWNRQLQKHHREGAPDRAWADYELMKETGVAPSAHTVAIVCGTLLQADPSDAVARYREVSADAERLRVPMDPHVVNAMLRAVMHFHCGDHAAMLASFRDVIAAGGVDLTVVNFNTMLQALEDSYDGAMAVLDEMGRARVVPDTLTFVNLFNAADPRCRPFSRRPKEATRSGSRGAPLPAATATATAAAAAPSSSRLTHERVMWTWAEYERFLAGASPDSRCFCKVLVSLGLSGRLAEARRFLEVLADECGVRQGAATPDDDERGDGAQVGTRTVNVWLGVLQAAGASAPEARAAYELWFSRRGVAPSALTFAALYNHARACSSAPLLNWAAAEQMLAGVAPTDASDSAYVRALSAAGRVRDAVEVVEAAHERGDQLLRESYNAVLGAIGRNAAAGDGPGGAGAMCVRVVAGMEEHGVAPDMRTFALLVTALYRAKEHGSVCDLLQHVRRTGLEPDYRMVPELLLSHLHAARRAGAGAEPGEAHAAAVDELIDAVLGDHRIHTLHVNLVHHTLAYLAALPGSASAAGRAVRVMAEALARGGNVTTRAHALLCRAMSKAGVPASRYLFAPSLHGVTLRRVDGAGAGAEVVRVSTMRPLRDEEKRVYVARSLRRLGNRVAEARRREQDKRA